ncbi:uncharacterized protein LACBIDRAFT_329917 [Laccaria bicolor S238N-H82]|uniref:Predicted protein n=1 Tax=Laccaria bicolor (strain S238N-H82 / ATCC MYA-4686) TaxID=486041 RepID=B0DJL9_LACBS|nr:uncharacterized protein LACBIDRAFT_329917 [Laccaria bicolor S238N-H82]EDR05230.1 predicted protein [Laccaria bicolor S238N-H82]|eukprot:XP_001884195.1 predicted protein [Laccaria bicolor S238N-H82]
MSLATADLRSGDKRRLFDALVCGEGEGVGDDLYAGAAYRGMTSITPRLITVVTAWMTGTEEGVERRTKSRKRTALAFVASLCDEAGEQLSGAKRSMTEKP